MTKYIPNKDTVMKDYLEYLKSNSQKRQKRITLTYNHQVLKFYVFSDIEYIFHYYLVDDTIEIEEINSVKFKQSSIPMMLRRQKLLRKFSLNQPGQPSANKFIRPQDIQYEYIKYHNRISQWNWR